MPCLLHKEGRGGERRPAAFFLRGLAACLLAVPFLAAACSVNLESADVKGAAGPFAGRTLPAGKPHPELWADPDRWVLIENPFYEPEDPVRRQEPQYVWADRDHLPLTVNRVVGGTRMVLAPPDVQARYAGDKVPPAR